MSIIVHIHSNNGFVVEVSDGTEYPPAGNNQQLSHEEFKAALAELNALAKKFAKPDAKPLSDYAMSRAGIYGDHP